MAKIFGRDLSDTAFSQPRLIIWTLGISVLLSLIFIFILGYQGKEIPPSLTMAAGFVIQAFTQKIKEQPKAVDNAVTREH